MPRIPGYEERVSQWQLPLSEGTKGRDNQCLTISPYGFKDREISSSGASLNDGKKGKLS
jgi:hypothetical protein